MQGRIKRTIKLINKTTLVAEKCNGGFIPITPHLKYLQNVIFKGTEN